jgi:hypothetical protein
MANFPTSVSTDANLFVAVNGLQTTLASPATNSDTTLTLVSTTGFPATGYVTVDNNEVVLYSGVSGAQLTGCTRGADGTTALSHSTGVTVGLTVVAAHHNLLKDEVKAIEGALGASFAKGNLTDAGTDGITVTGGTAAVIGSGTSLSQHVSDSTHNGYLSSTDWSTFNGKQNTLTTGNVSAGSSKISIGGSPTGAVIGSGVSVDLGAVTLDNLSDVIVPSPATNDILAFNGTNWVNAAAPASSLPLAGGTMTGDITMSNQTGIVLKELTANGTSSIALRAADDVTASYTLKLPPAVGTGNQTLVDIVGDGVLSWGASGGSTINKVTYTVGTATGSYSGSTTVFGLPFNYIQDGKNLEVIYNGQVLTLTTDYTETSTTSVTTSSALVVGATVTFRSIASVSTVVNGTISSGTTPLLAFYATTGTTLSGVNANASMGSNKVTNLAAGTAASDAVNFGQIYYGFQAAVQGTSVTTFSTTSSTFQTTNLTASITPTSSSHRVKITISAMLRSSNGAVGNTFYSIDRSGTDLGASGSAGFGRMADTVGILSVPLSLTYIDSPTTTSALTYTATVRSDNTSNAAVLGTTGTQIITLEEIV